MPADNGLRATETGYARVPGCVAWCRRRARFALAVSHPATQPGASITLVRHSALGRLSTG